MNRSMVKGKISPARRSFLPAKGPVISPYIVHCILGSNIIYENNIFISITRTEDPFGIETHYQRDFAPGLHLFDIQAGYMTVIDIEKLLKENGIKKRSFSTV